MRQRDPAKLYPHDYAMKVLILPLIPHFVTPNYVTAARMVLTPLSIWGLATEQYAWAIPFFIGVAFTDVIDGSLARVRKQITDWGTLFDPIADKILIALAAVVVVTKVVGWWLTLLLVTCEFAVVLGAVRKKHEGKIVMANQWGKTKMVAQCLGITLLLFSTAFGIPLLAGIGTGVLTFAIVFAVISIITYSW